MFSKFLRTPSPSFLLYFMWKHISHSIVMSKEGEVTTKHSLTHSFWKARTAFSFISLLFPSLLIVAYYSKIKFTQQNGVVLRPPAASTETTRLPAPESPKTHSKFLLMPNLCVLSFQSNHMLKVTDKEELTLCGQSLFCKPTTSPCLHHLLLPLLQQPDSHNLVLFSSFNTPQTNSDTSSISAG